MKTCKEAPGSRRYLPLFPAWVLAHGLGGAIAGILEVQLPFLGLLILTGIPIGLVQSFALHSALRRAWRWGVITALAWPLVNLLEISLFQLPGDWLVQSLTATGLLWEVFWLNLVRMALVLALVAVPQGWLVPPLGGQPWAWVVASLVGGAVLGAMGATACLWWCPVLQPISVGIVLGGLSWLGYALVTGWVLHRWQGERSPHP